MTALIVAAEVRFREWRTAVVAHHRRRDWAIVLAFCVAAPSGIIGSRVVAIVGCVVAVVAFLVVARRLSERRRSAHEALLAAIERCRIDGSPAEVAYGLELSKRAVAFADGVAVGLGGGT